MKAYKFWTNEEISILEQLINNGFTYAAIGEELNRPTGSIACKAKKIGLRSARSKKLAETQRLKKQGIKRCWKCNIIKPLTLENFRRKSGYCRTCESQMQKEFSSHSVRNCLNARFSAAKTRAIRKDVPFEITLAHLIRLWEQQDGKCFYSGEQMTINGDSRYSVSVDRVIPELGYTLENIVLCCTVVNRMKTNLTVEELKNWCQSILTH